MSLFAVQQSTDPNHSSNFSPSSIINAANAKVPEDIPGAEMIFQGALLEWVDIATESGQEGSDAYQIMKDAVVDLWIGYADFYRNLKKVRLLLFIFYYFMPKISLTIKYPAQRFCIIFLLHL